jgi:uncharacterized protein (TIGR02145 family)
MKHRYFHFQTVFCLMFLLMILAPATARSETETGTVTDVDGNVYKTVKIGDYWWMAENLKTKHFQNGDSLSMYPEIYFNTSGQPVTGGSKYDYCVHYTYPNRNAANAAVYGLNYTWSAVFDSRNICPEGWSVPDTTVWFNLAHSIGVGKSTTEGFSEVGKYLKSSTLWKFNESSTAAVDSFGFNAVPSGDFNSNGYTLFGEQARFWTIHEVCAGMAGRYYVYLKHDVNDLLVGTYRNNSTISVRCVKPVNSVGLKKNAADLTVALYPNPASDFVQIAAGEGYTHWNIMDVCGRILSSGTLDKGATQTVSVASFPVGLYMVKVNGSKASKILNFIKK